MAETTPFLDDIGDNNHNNHNDDAQRGVHGEWTPASAYFKRPIKGLNIITIVSSALTVTLLIANYIVIACAPFRYYSGQWTQSITSELAIWIFMSFAFAVTNVLVNVPILINIIFDIVLPAIITPGVFRFLEALPNYNWCQISNDPWPNPQPNPPPECESWKLVVTVLMGVAAGFGGIVCISYMVLLLLRSIAVIKTKFWKRSLSWPFPPGEITLQFSIKVLRQENPSTSNGSGVGQSTEAGPESVRQPLVAVD